MLPGLNEHEQRIVRFIERFMRRFHFTPTMEEIRQGVDLSSKDHVFRDLRSVEEKGYIKRKRRVSRGIELVFTAEGLPFSLSTIHLPLLGWIVAGEPLPILDEYPSVMDAVEIASNMIHDGEDLFALRVKGNSMIDALINEGDIVVMKHQKEAENGDMVAVWLRNEQETTLKRFYREGDVVRLQPANPTMEPIYVPASDVKIQGKVILVLRDCNGKRELNDG